MDDEQFYNQVIAYKKPLRKDGFFLAETDIQPDEIRHIASETNADAVISLNVFVVLLNYKAHYRYGNLTAAVHAKFNVYDAVGNPIGEPVLYQDSFQMDRSYLSSNTYRTNNVLFEMKKSLRESAIYAADKVASMLAPHWQQQERWIFYSGLQKESREATLKATANEWKEAAQIWSDLYEQEDNSLKKAKLASNIAVANEMQDDVESAFAWANISYELFGEYGEGISNPGFTFVSNYCKDLKTRIDDFKKLDEQKRGSE
jgi:hypothetical protein